MSKEQQDADVELYKEFLRINTMHPNPNLAACVEWLKQQAKVLNMSIMIEEFVKGLPIVVLSKQGTEPSLPSIGLNCHMDVVPVVPEKWTALPTGETPFTAWEDGEGKIYARGSQDMKCVGAQYLCALRRLAGTNFRRTIHTIWVPDEEIGGANGMRRFVDSEMYKKMNLGCCLDEGLAHEENKWVIYYGERTPMWVTFTAIGEVGHASKLMENTAMERLSRVIAEMTARRDRSVKKLQENPKMTLGDVTSVNMTVARGYTSNDEGKTYAYNVIPSEAKVAFDLRITFNEFDEVVADIQRLAKKYNCEASFIAGNNPTKPSQLSDTESVWCRTMVESLSQWGAEVERTVFPAATDARYLRMIGLPSYGFSPMRKTPSLLHDHNEYLSRATYLEGVDVYVDLIPKLANVSASASKI